jgi:hypothetical protein
MPTVCEFSGPGARNVTSRISLFFSARSATKWAARRYIPRLPAIRGRPELEATMTKSRRRTMTWLGLPVAALVAGGAGLALTSAGGHPARAALESATSRTAIATPSPSPSRTSRTPGPVPSRTAVPCPSGVPTPTPTRRAVPVASPSSVPTPTPTCPPAPVPSRTSAPGPVRGRSPSPSPSPSHRSPSASPSPSPSHRSGS